ncbi:MAG: hypothetical protein ACYC26_06620 [Phycisphaerales bacterium]
MGVQRNLLIVLTGGMRGDALGGAGVWPVDTPHLDRLASRGLAVTGISATVSGKAGLRSVYEGLHVRQSGGGAVGGFVRRLREGGYHTAGVGRVGLIADALDEHHIVAEADQLDSAGCHYLRFAERRGLMGYVEYQRKQRMRSGLFEAEEGIGEPGEDVDGYIAEQAVEMMARMPSSVGASGGGTSGGGGKPWAMVVAFTGPGNDLPAPGMYWDAVSPAKLASGFIPAAVGEVDRYATLEYPRHLLQQVDARRAAMMRRHYLGRVMMIDCCAGMLRDAAAKRTDRGSTWMLLTSDRGTAMGERGLFGCRTFVGSGAYVPVWVVPPDGVDAARAGDEALREDDELVSGVDFAATVCALAGVDESRGCTGRSLLAGFGGNVGCDAVMSEDERTVLLHTERHKAVYESATGELRMLFDLKHDAQERTNLADSPYHANVMDQLQATLGRVLLRLGAGHAQ